MCFEGRRDVVLSPWVLSYIGCHSPHGSSAARRVVRRVFGKGKEEQSYNHYYYTISIEN